MNKLIFKNNTLNILVGFVFIVFTVVAFFLEWYASALAIIIGIILILLSAKRFIYTYKKVISKKATLILAGEFLLDIVFAALMIFLNDYIAIFIGLIIYIRGLTYLMINYVVKRKVIFLQYLTNILLITLGSFLIFTGIDLASYLEYIFAGFVLLVGIVYFVMGAIQIKPKKKPAPKPAAAPAAKPAPKPETVVTPKPVVKPAPKPVPKPPVKVDYSKMTVAELQVIAKERKLTGISQLNKTQLIEALSKKAE